MWTILYVVVVKFIYEYSIQEYCYTSAMIDNGTCLQFLNYNKVVHFGYVKVPRSICARIPSPLAIPSFSYPLINITKRLIEKGLLYYLDFTLMGCEWLQLSNELCRCNEDSCGLPFRCHLETSQFLIMIRIHLISVYDDFTRDKVVIL